MVTCSGCGARHLHSLALLAIRLHPAGGNPQQLAPSGQDDLPVPYPSSNWFGTWAPAAIETMRCKLTLAICILLSMKRARNR